MRQLVGVHDRVDAGDDAAVSLERQHADQVFLSIANDRAGPAVDLRVTQRPAGDTATQAEPGHQGARDMLTPMDRAREGRNLAAAVTGQRDVLSEESLETGEVALLSGREELSCKR